MQSVSWKSRQKGTNECRTMGCCSDVPGCWSHEGTGMEVKAGYRQTEVGVIPEDWVVKPLGELGTFKNGINKGKEDFGHGFPFVNLMDVFGIATVSNDAGLGLVNSTVAERKLYELKRGDVLFVRSSVKPEGVGLTALVCDNLSNTVFSGFLIRFRDNDQLAEEYKKYCFGLFRFRSSLIANSTVSANTNINQDALKSLQLVFPPQKREQRAIATALSDVDALITSLDKLIAKKRDIKQAAMQELLTGKRRLPGFSGEWPTTCLGELGNFSKGNGIKKDDVLTDGLPCIRYGEIYTRHNDYIRKFYSFISEDVAKGSQQIKKGDLLFAGSGETTEDIGKCVAYVDDNEAYAGGDIIILSPKKDNSMYLGYLINHPSVASQKAKMGQGEMVVHISGKNLAKLIVNLPSVEEQTAIATILSDMDADLETLERKRDKTKAIKQGMMQELLTGRIRLV